jgi:hypothetical protein
MIVISKKKTRTCNAFVQWRVLQLFFIIMCFLTLVYEYDYSDNALPLSTSTSDLLPDIAVEEPLPLTPNVVTEQRRRAQKCPKEIDGLQYVKQRRRKMALSAVRPWQLSLLNDKWGFYVFCKANGIRVPEMYMCSADGTKPLKDWREPADGLGFVVKVKDGHSAKGVYLMESGFGGREQISGDIMTREVMIKQLVRDLAKTSRKKPLNSFHAEELLKGPTGGIPPDYKFWVANGEILYADITFNRGNEMKCEAYVNEQFDRVDEHGCFGRNKNYQLPIPGQCSVSTIVGPIVGLKRCGDFARPKDWDKLLAMAKKMSRIIGIFVRIDMYVHQGEVVMGEASFTPTAGHYHCGAKLDENGCIDPCLFGRFWKRQNDAFNTTEGGPIMPEPAAFKGWEQMSDKEKCERVMEASSNSKSPPF